MATVYKVWIEIEEYDTATGDGENREDLNMELGAAVATFGTPEDALDFARRLQAQGAGVGIDEMDAEDCALCANSDTGDCGGMHDDD